MYEHFEHTADLGLRVESSDLDTLFAEAAEALTAAIVEDVAAVEPRQAADFRIAGGDRAHLLLDWLKAVLMKFEMDHVLFREFRVRVGADGLTATARGEPYDPDRHPLSHEVKAITYHGLVVEPADGGWRAEVIVDI
jgi:SHS2 domain-containing protein